MPGISCLSTTARQWDVNRANAHHFKADDLDHRYMIGGDRDLDQSMPGFSSTVLKIQA